jgi:hypothetical protein
MNRRSFVRALGCFGMVAPARSRFYTFETSDLKAGSVRGRAGVFFEALVAPSMPQTLTIQAFDSFPANTSNGSAVLQSAPNLIDIRTAAANNARIFELRVYHSGPAMEILHRSGIHPILYSPTTFFIPFDSLAAREKAWTAFSADPEWIKLRQSSRIANISLWKAANIEIAQVAC